MSDGFAVKMIGGSASFNQEMTLALDKAQKAGYDAGQRMSRMPARGTPMSYISAGYEHHDWIRAHTDALVHQSALDDKGKAYLRGMLDGRGEGIKRAVRWGAGEQTTVVGAGAYALWQFSKVPTSVSLSPASGLVVRKVPAVNVGLFAATAVSAILSGTRTGIDQIKLLSHGDIEERRQLYGKALKRYQRAQLDDKAGAALWLQRKAADLSGEILIQLHAQSLTTFRFLQSPGKFQVVLSSPEQQAIRQQMDGLLAELYSVARTASEIDVPRQPD